MKKIVDIELLEGYVVLCVFENGEKKILDLTKVLDKSNKYASKVLNKHTFGKAKVGSLGQIYWDSIAEIKNFEGISEPCEYDISPEFAYANSTSTI